MYEVKSKIRKIKGVEVETWEREIIDANILSVEAGTTKSTKRSLPATRKQRAALTRWRLKFTTRIPAANPSSITLRSWKNARMPSPNTMSASGTAWWNS